MRSSSIVDNFSTLVSQDFQLGLAYFYCDGTSNVSAKTETRYILGSILRQLLSRIQPQEWLARIEKLHEDEKTLVNQEFALNLANSILLVAQWFPHVYIFIDGVDECQSREDFWC